MRRRVIAIVAGLGLLALASGGVAYWFLAVPDQIAEEHRDRAEPEHTRVARAMDRVGETLEYTTLSFGDFRKVNKLEGRRYLRAYRRVSRARYRRLRRPAREIAAARQVLRRVDRERLLDVPTKPFLGGSDAVKGAEAITGRERGYLAAADGALDAYEGLLGYQLAVQRLEDRIARLYARVSSSLPNTTVNDPKLLTVPLDRFARALTPYRRAFLRLDAPRALRDEPRQFARAIAAVIRGLRGQSAAYSRFDNAGAQRAGRRAGRALRRVDRRTRDSLEKTVEESAAADRLAKLNGLDGRIRRAYDAL